MEYIIDNMFGIAYIDGMKLRNHVKQHRARLDLTQEDLARRVGVRRQTILAVEKGRFVPSALLAFQLARALGMPVAELFELDEEEGDHEA
jgi:putative transcriptional regulator